MLRVASGEAEPESLAKAVGDVVLSGEEVPETDALTEAVLTVESDGMVDALGVAAAEMVWLRVAVTVTEDDTVIDTVLVAVDSGEALDAAEGLASTEAEGMLERVAGGLREAAGDREPALLGELVREAEMLRVAEGERVESGEEELSADGDEADVGEVEGRLLPVPEGVPVGERDFVFVPVPEGVSVGVRELEADCDGERELVVVPVGEREALGDTDAEGDLEDVMERVGVCVVLVETLAERVAEMLRVPVGVVVADGVGFLFETVGVELFVAAGEKESECVLEVVEVPEREAATDGDSWLENVAADDGEGDCDEEIDGSAVYVGLPFDAVAE